MDQPAAPSTPTRRPPIPFSRYVVGGLVLVFLAGLVGWWIGQPGEESFSNVDSGFLADMTDHHQGAINLAFEYLHNESSPVIGNIAREIITDQSSQIGLMNSLLGEAGNPSTVGDGIAMDWMGETVPSSEMPGLATQAQFDELRAATGLEADDLFTRLMIQHHAAGVAMSDEAAAQGENDRVRRFARGVAALQRGEIKDMNLQRERLGLEPVTPDFNIHRTR